MREQLDSVTPPEENLPIPIPTEGIMATYGYIRVSTIEQADGSSLDEQDRKVRGVALIRGVDVERVFVDPGVSGSVALDKRPAGSALLATLRKGDTLIVAKLDRAFRNATDALTRSDEFKAMGVKLILADIGTDPVTENGTGRMFFGMLALMAEFERDRILERTNDGRQAKKRAGGFIGGTAPFGYRVEGQGKDAVLVPVPEQSKALADLHRMRQAGSSLRAIAKHITEQHGFPISHEAVRRTTQGTV
jgi:DNA invertase Pin-like site-specific DNA recombinase